MNATLPAIVNDLWLLVGWTMVHFLWLGAIVAAFALAGRLILRHAAPTTRYAFALVCLTLITAMPTVAAWFSTGSTLASAARPNLPPSTTAIPNTPTPIPPPTTLAPPAPPIIELNPFSRDAQRSTSPAQIVPPQPAPTFSPPSAPGSAGGLPPTTAEFPAAFALQPPADPRQSRGLTGPNVGETFNQLAACIPYLPWLWLIGTPLTFALLFTGLIGTRRLSRASTPITAGPIADALARLTTSLHITRRVTVAVCERVAAPVLIGIVRPMILLPPAALIGWSPDEIEMVLLHELAHIRRYDNVVNFAQRIIESLLFFHPAVWLISTWVRRERETCCDAAVVTRTQQPHAYAELLLNIASKLSERSDAKPSPSGSGQGEGAPRIAPTIFSPASPMAAGPLRTRIRHILQLEDDPMLITPKSLAITLATLLTAATLAFVYLPKIGQAEPSATEATENTEKKESADATNTTNKSDSSGTVLTADKLDAETPAGRAVISGDRNHGRIKAVAEDTPSSKPRSAADDPKLMLSLFQTSDTNPIETKWYGVPSDLRRRLSSEFEGWQFDPYGPQVSFDANWSNGDKTLTIRAPKAAHDKLFQPEIKRLSALLASKRAEQSTTEGTENTEKKQEKDEAKSTEPSPKPILRPHDFVVKRDNAGRTRLYMNREPIAEDVVRRVIANDGQFVGKVQVSLSAEKGIDDADVDRIAVLFKELGVKKLTIKRNVEAVEVSEGPEVTLDWPIGVVFTSEKEAGISIRAWKKLGIKVVLDNSGPSPFLKVVECPHRPPTMKTGSPVVLQSIGDQNAETLDTLNAALNSLSDGEQVVVKCDVTTDQGKGEISFLLRVGGDNARQSSGKSATNKFPTLEDQKLADLAWKRLGLELEHIAGDDLQRVKALGYDGGAKVAAGTAGVSEGGGFSGNPSPRIILPNDILVGLHVWPTPNLKDIAAVLNRDDLAELNPLKFYVVRRIPERMGGGPTDPGKDTVVSGRISVQIPSGGGDGGYGGGRTFDNAPTPAPARPQPTLNSPTGDLDNPSAPSRPARGRADPSSSFMPRPATAPQFTDPAIDGRKLVEVPRELWPRDPNAPTATPAATPLRPLSTTLDQPPAGTSPWPQPWSTVPATPVPSTQYQGTPNRYNAGPSTATPTLSNNNPPALHSVLTDSAGPPPALASPPPTPRPSPTAALRYDGKPFEEWRNVWKTELSTEKRIEALKALEAFAAAGLEKEVNSAIVDGIYSDSLATAQHTRKYLSTLNAADAAPVVRSLQSTIKTELSSRRRIDALRALAAIGPAAASALDDLKTVLATKDPQVRIAAATAIKRIVGKDQYQKPVADVLGNELGIEVKETSSGVWGAVPRDANTKTDAFLKFTEDVIKEQELLFPPELPPPPH